MNIFTKLPFWGILAGAGLGASLFLAVRAAVPLPLTDLNSGALRPYQVVDRLFLIVPVTAGLAAAGLAFAACRVISCPKPGRGLAACLLGAVTGLVGAGLSAALLPNAPEQFPLMFAAAGPTAFVGAALGWWIADASSAELI